MTETLQRLHKSRAMGWRAILGLLLVPIVAAGVLLWGLWNPTERLDRVTAAVVNLDEPVTIDGQIVPLGRVLAGELIDSDAENNFTWVLTDADDAAQGLDDGRYASVVTIPEAFSSQATSISRGADEAETAVIDIVTSERGRLLDAALSNIVTTTATTVLNQQLGAQYVGGLLVGITEIGDGVREAAEGADQLAAGQSQLADGANQLAAGTSQLASGAQQFAAGTQQFADGAQSAAVGGSQYAAGVESYVNGVNAALGQVSAGAPQTAGLLQMLQGAVAADAVAPPAGVSKDQFLAQLGQAIAGLNATPTQLAPLIAGGDPIKSGAWALANGQSQLASGAAGLVTGANGISTGITELSTGITDFSAGVRQAADGTTELAAGLQEAGDEIPAYTDEESEQLAEVGVQPVQAAGANDELFNAAGVPLFAGIALWAGAFASFLVLAPLWRRSLEAARSVWFIALRSAVPALALGAAQGAMLGAVLPPLLGYDLQQWLGFFGFSVLAGVSFSLVTQGLSALFGGVGRFASFVLLVVAFAIGVIATAPPVLQTIGDASPIGALFAGFQAVATGVGASGAAAATLVVWGLVGSALTLFAVARARRRAIA